MECLDCSSAGALWAHSPAVSHMCTPGPLSPWHSAPISVDHHAGWHRGTNTRLSPAYSRHFWWDMITSEKCWEKPFCGLPVELSGLILLSASFNPKATLQTLTLAYTVKTYLSAHNRLYIYTIWWTVCYLVWRESKKLSYMEEPVKFPNSLQDLR